MKKLHLAFGIIALAVIVIGLIHGGIAWIIAEVTWNPLATSFPTWGAFVLTFLFYGIAGSIVLFVWAVTWIIVRIVQRSRSRKSNSREIIRS